jgi:hypothetical protein
MSKPIGMLMISVAAWLGSMAAAELRRRPDYFKNKIAARLSIPVQAAASAHR